MNSPNSLPGSLLLVGSLLAGASLLAWADFTFRQWRPSEASSSIHRSLPLTHQGWGAAILVWSYCCLAFPSNWFIALLISCAVLCAFSELDPISAFGLESPTFNQLLLKPVYAYFLCFFPVIMSAHTWALFCQWVGIEVTQQDSVELFFSLEKMSDKISFMILAIVIAPIWEETLFRGVLYGWMKDWAPRPIALLVSSVTFASAHHHLPTFLPLALLGCGLALLYDSSRCLWSSIIMHAIFNGVTLMNALAFGKYLRL